MTLLPGSTESRPTARCDTARCPVRLTAQTPQLTSAHEYAAPCSRSRPALPRGARLRRATPTARTINVIHADALEKLERHILMDGFRIVFDHEKSRGSYMYDAATGHRLDRLLRLLRLGAGRLQSSAFREAARSKRSCSARAKTKIANSDVYSQAYADFVETFTRVAPLPPLEPLSLHRRRRARDRELPEGGDGLEGAQKHGRRPRRTRHGDHAFPARVPRAQRLHDEPDEHRSDARRICSRSSTGRASRPRRSTSRSDGEAREADVIAREKKAEQEIMQFIAERGVDIAAIIIEPIQGEGGDNHFRGEWLQTLAPHLRRERDAPDLRRSAVRAGHDGPQLVLRAFRREAGPDGVRQEGAGLRRDGRAAAR